MKTVLLFALLFVFLGFVLIPYNGLESDEVIFAQPLRADQPDLCDSRAPSFHSTDGNVVHWHAEKFRLLAIVLDKLLLKIRPEDIAGCALSSL
jgi:hypothetical protein